MDKTDASDAESCCPAGNAFYGHKHSGVFWQRFCDKQVTEAGFEPLGESWPCVYFHPVTKMLLIVYVDDMKLAAKGTHGGYMGGSG